ncbi:MAG: hypothetical protein Q4G64_05040, partial [bacterium]|nr:hypothetical protein [bacterium]
GAGGGPSFWSRAMITAGVVIAASGLIGWLIGLPYVMLPRWIRRRVDAGDPVIQPDLPERHWSRSSERGLPPSIPLPTPDDAGPPARNLLTTFRSEGSVTLPILRRHYARWFVVSAVLAPPFAWASYGAFRDGEGEIAGASALFSLVAFLSLSLNARIALGGGAVVVGQEGISMRTANFRWEEMAGFGVQEGPRGRVTVAVNHATAEEVEDWGLIGTAEENHEIRALLPVTRTDPWDMAEFLALAHAEWLGSAPATPEAVRRVAWVELGPGAAAAQSAPPDPAERERQARGVFDGR